jgi:uncharacterized protein affecting Mg2+/Co2+ transport
LLQPPLNHRDYGQARVIDAAKCMLWRDKMILDRTGKSSEDNADRQIEHHKKVLAFSKKWTQKEDTEEKKEVGNFDELFGISHSDEEEEDDGRDSDISDLSLYTSYSDLRYALRQGFRDFESEGNTKKKKDIIAMQRFAIDSISLLEDQRRMWDRTSISIDKERGIRVIATSRCIGASSSVHRGLKIGSEVKHRFAYRIRIENFNDSDSEESNNVQLLGRTWKILEDEEEYLKLHDGEDDKGREVNVVAPTTGAVGHLPVIRPGQAFEYMSGCELGTSIGTMSGCFHLAMVDNDAKSCQVGDHTDAFNLPREKHFEMEVQSFKLVAEGA